MDVSIWVIVANMIVLLGAIIFSFYISKRTRNNEGWAVGGRALPVYVVILTQFATASGGGMRDRLCFRLERDHLWLVHRSGSSCLTVSCEMVAQKRFY
ncbi:hypothetical protein [Shouchella clausii]|uniref:hypothetical protein n=1 Tax=Shouchella clausii TaxID=79880 RepID=UPI00211CE2CD|nr:hypothetical protein [Shouchella clausii]